MQLTKAFVLLALAAYVRGQCAACANTVGGEAFVSSCTQDAVSETYCNYAYTNNCVYVVRAWLPLRDERGNI
ncbi:hypothetical protein M404DRAFT_1001691 [Pisolithus tinctorius Marx 270]|uniref:Uncharacterized protein n=1 Tax=Pisolithus tinctorius Marx 270 TaxID=870435 RepID=A0A0C3J1V8_PISTI|nr:hypothetical protein M404DRAFT_1001691 [Pisolithus tinctorius Marx 270]